MKYNNEHIYFTSGNRAMISKKHFSSFKRAFDDYINKFAKPR